MANGCRTCNDDGGPCAKCGHRVGQLQAGKGWSGFGGSTTGTQTQTHSSSGKQSTFLPGVSFKGCDHRAAEAVITIDRGKSGKLFLYAAQGAKLADPQAKVGHLDVILDLAGMVKRRQRFIVEGPRKYLDLNHEICPDVVRFDWPDMTAPVHARLGFWQSLLHKLPPHTAIACIGGHGRTGTALAALLIASGMDATLAIATVRQHHCNKAIETAGQEAYLKGLR